MAGRPDAPPESAGSDGATEMVALGAIARPHGVRGDLRVHPFNPDSTLFGRLERVWIYDEATPEDAALIAIVRTRKGPKGWLTTFEGVSGRDAADALRGKLVGIPRDELPEAEEDEYYLVDLEGLDVVQGETVLGQVERVLEYPSIECLEVFLEDGVIEIPLNRPWVDRVDVEAGVVRVGDLSDIPVQKTKKRKR